MRATALFMLFCTAVWIGVTMYFGLTQMVGIVFIVALVIYAIIAWSIARKDTTEDTKEELAIMATPAWRMVMLILIGLVGLPLGSQMLVDGGISLGDELGASETIVGLTILAVGSSLPELGASVAAAVRKQSDVAMGNILGSNIFNILGAGGVVAILGPRSQLSPEFTAFSNWAMAGAAVLVAIVIFLHRRVGVLTGLLFLLCYAVYIYGLWANWSLQGLGDLIIQPTAQTGGGSYFGVTRAGASSTSHPCARTSRRSGRAGAQLLVELSIAVGEAAGSSCMPGLWPTRMIELAPAFRLPASAFRRGRDRAI